MYSICKQIDICYEWLWMASGHKQSTQTHIGTKTLVSLRAALIKLPVETSQPQKPKFV